MNFEPDEEQRLLAASVARLFEDHGAQPSADPVRQWRDYRDMGLLGLPFAEANGGHGGRFEDVMLVMEAYGRALGQVPYPAVALLAGRLLEAAGGPTAQALLAEMIAGTKRVALALYEPGRRYRWDDPATAAECDGEGWTLTGAKIAVLGADRETVLLCPATTAEGLRLFAVPAGTAGVAMEMLPTPDGRQAANVRCDDARIPAAAEIGDPARNPALIAAAVDGAIAAACAEMVGAMERLLGLTVDYLGVRRQFGVAIGSFQALQHRAADMLMAIEQARSMTIHAVAMLDAPAAERTVAVAAAKALVNRSSRFVGQQAIQLHGGMGLTAEYPAGRYFQRLTVLENLFGDTGHHLDIVERAGV
ncbi:acyl-CoA dehydrogenase family protein [Rhizorhabdus histidinilytica]|uniref:acyl-CoA dehydrogenase family protein n=1 Tax=Rhizorhabdus histidinilytica TaxID=439228 RepID=UPI0032205676